MIQGPSIRKDSRGNPDICREVFTKVEPDAATLVADLKLTINQLIADFNRLFAMNTHNSDALRLLAIAATHFEEGCMFAVNAMTSQGFRTGAPGERPIDPPV